MEVCYNNRTEQLTIPPSFIIVADEAFPLKQKPYILPHWVNKGEVYQGVEMATLEGGGGGGLIVLRHTCSCIIILYSV